MTEAELNTLTQRVIGVGVGVHHELGPGLDEQVYEQALSLALSAAGLGNERQVPLPVLYRGHQLNCGYRLDILVESALILEIKSVAAILPIHEAQLLTYLRVSGQQLGLLLNYNVVLLRDGIARRVNRLGFRGPSPDSAAGQPEHAATDLESTVIAAAIQVHRALGPGLLKSSYAECLQVELSTRGVTFVRGVIVPVRYEGAELGRPFEMEFLIDGVLPVMLVSAADVTPLVEAQFRSRLRLGGWREGLLLNFGAPTLKDGLRRLGLATQKLAER